MNNVKIIKKVLIKQVLTEQSKAQIKKRLENNKSRLELECQQLLFEQKKLANRINHSKHEIEARFSNEMKQRKDKMTLIDFRIEQLELLVVGSEVIEKEVDALTEVKVGTSWEEIMQEQSIIIKDGTVIRIDNE